MKKKTIFVIFGATGDLMQRKLIPAFFCMQHHKKDLDEFEVLSIGRRDISQKQYLDEFVLPSLEKYSSCYDKNLVSSYIEKMTYVEVDFKNTKSFSIIKKEIEKRSKEYQTQVIYYLSVPPSLFSPILEALSENGLSEQNEIPKKIAFEKPFGTNLGSARKLNSKIMQVFSEDQVYRIDHYLGKEAVQNFLVLRFANHFLEPLWNNRHVDNIQITVSETLGVGSRAQYYEESGALRDMVQNHLFQMLSLIAMEPPASLDPESIRDEKVKIFSSIKPLEENSWSKNVVFGQYDKAVIDGKLVPGYTEEEGVAKNSKTETFVALKLEIDNWRWAGVPFYLRTGKRIKEKGTTVVVEFKKVPHILYNLTGNLESNKLVISIQPDEKITMQFNVKGTQGKPMLASAEFDHRKQFNINTPEAYENILNSIINSDNSMFTRWDAVEKSWEIVDKLVECHDNCPVVYKYDSGTWGPVISNKLLENDGRRWNQF